MLKPWKDCPKCHSELEEIGQEVLSRFHSIYVYECQECHEIIRLPYQLVKPKERFVFR